MDTAPRYGSAEVPSLQGQPRPNVQAIQVPRRGAPPLRLVDFLVCPYAPPRDAMLALVDRSPGKAPSVRWAILTIVDTAGSAGAALKCLRPLGGALCLQRNQDCISGHPCE